MRNSTIKIVADFETTVYDGQESTEVWAAAFAPLYSDGEVHILNNISDFMVNLRSYRHNLIVWFHNLKFDGTFIINFLLDGGYTFTTKRGKEMPPYSFSCLISNKRRFYNICIKFDKCIVELRDSLKLVPFSLAQAASAFNTEHKKLEMEYKGYRYAGCEITPQEMAYIRNDVLVLKEVMEHMDSMGTNRLTIGSCAMNEYKGIAGKDEYKTLFPDLSKMGCPFEGYETAEKYIRKFYKGAWCYAKEKGRVGAGHTYDVNGLYSYVMHSMSGNYYPSGEPIWFEGEIPQKAMQEGRVYFTHIRCRFELKQGYLPTIQIKNSLAYNPREWLETSRVKFNGKYYETVEKLGKTYTSTVDLYLTDSDYELFLKHYDVYDMEYIDGCWFYGVLGAFDGYIDKWAEIKEKAETKVKRTIAKLYLNNLYGKFATSDDSSYLVPSLGENGEVVFDVVESHEKEPGYIAAGAKITANARCYTITHSQANYGIFCYADTDSMHCTGEAVGIEMDMKKLGAWKRESDWSSAIFIRAKTYAEFIRARDGEKVYPHWEITCAGMPERSKKLFLETHPITDFKYGLVVGGKLVPKNIKGGVILEEREFTLRKK